MGLNLSTDRVLIRGAAMANGAQRIGCSLSGPSDDRAPARVVGRIEIGEQAYQGSIQGSFDRLPQAPFGHLVAAALEDPGIAQDTGDQAVQPVALHILSRLHGAPGIDAFGGGLHGGPCLQCLRRRRIVGQASPQGLASRHKHEHDGTLRTGGLRVLAHASLRHGPLIAHPHRHGLRPTCAHHASPCLGCESVARPCSS